MERRPVRRSGGIRLDTEDAVYGIHAVEEALRGGETLRSLAIAADRKNDPALSALLRYAKEREVAVRFEPRGYFERMPVRAHQGVVAMSAPFAYYSLHELLRRKPRSARRLYVVLDHLTDPHNVGAILRTAECAGVDGLVLPDRRSASINATVRKVAAGAAAHLPVARVPNVADALRSLRDAGIWAAGADAGPDAVDMHQADLTGELALVVGAEGSGLSRLVRRECAFLVRIPMHGAVESLNASVAAGVLLFEALGQRARAGSV